MRQQVLILYKWLGKKFYVIVKEVSLHRKDGKSSREYSECPVFLVLSKCFAKTFCGGITDDVDTESHRWATWNEFLEEKSLLRVLDWKTSFSCDTINSGCPRCAV